MPRLGLEVLRPSLYGLSWLWWSGNNSSPSDGDIHKDSVVVKFLNKTIQAQAKEGNKRDLLANDQPTSIYARSNSLDTIPSCRTKVTQSIMKHGIPGLVVGVSYRGRTVWSEAFGYCDVENLTLCKPGSVMRVASISKSITMATCVAKLIEDNKLNIESSIHDYVEEKDFPRQKYKDTIYDIKLRHLLCNSSGIRHYYKDGYPDNILYHTPIGSPKSPKAHLSRYEIDRVEYYQRNTYRNVLDSLEIFKHDSLVCEPGTKFSYSTYGWVLVSAIVQKVLKDNVRFEDYLMRTLQYELGMKNTHLDQDEPLVFNRSKYYTRNGVSGLLMNAPSVDNSCKWSGGGLLSNTDDLLKFANTLIHSYKGRENSFLKPQTVRSMWTAIIPMGGDSEIGDHYGLGFMVGSDDLSNSKSRKDKGVPFEFYVYHTGSAVGASSILMILPEEEFVVAILTNLEKLNLRRLAFDILEEFTKQMEP